jgi:class 3 adenylate cyclase
VGTTAFETLLEEGRHAVTRRAWPEGFEALSRADAVGALEADDLEALGKAAYWAGRPTESIEADERAYARRLHGFAPRVRIGLHAAEATRTDGNYTGMGVHTAARVGAVAGPGEIVATSASVAGLDALDLADRRSATLKGIAEPVEIVTIAWR